MVETFVLIEGKKPLPSFNELVQDIYDGNIKGVSRFCNHSNHRYDTYSVCLKTRASDGSATYLHAHRDIDPDSGKVLSESISMISRYGNNFAAANVILPLICKRYGCGCSSDSDWVIIEPKVQC